MNAVQERAVKMTSRGGIKTTQLAGEILNNKNVKKPFTFPDTSNTRFQSHCEGAGVLMQHLPHFINFLKYIQVKKNVMRFSQWKKTYGKLYTALQQRQNSVFLHYMHRLSVILI